MSPSVWSRVSALFDEALERPPGERDDWIMTACGGDTDLEREVRRLLDAHDRAGILDRTIGAVAADAVTESAPAPSGVLGPYRLLREVGRGGMGIVFQARDERLDRHVALKLLPRHLHFDDRAKRRLLAEARAASALDHSNICTIYDVGESEDGAVYVAMAFYEGRTLANMIADTGALPIETAVLTALQVTAGLRHAHAAGVVHRDIKPSNIMVTQRGDAKILDFGVAKLADRAPDHRPDARVGTVHYMSPEQAQGQEVDHRTDLWSLGVVLYEMLSGVVPFRGRDDADTIIHIRTRDPDPPSTIRPEVPAALDAVVARALARDPATRYPDASALLADLRAFAATTDLAGRRRSTSEAPRPSLPATITSFVGREREVQRVRSMLRAARLVTLTGPAGTGKTRLALRVGSESDRDYEHGVCFVPLAPIADSALVASAIAQAVGAVEAVRGSAVDGLKRALRDRRMLLILDNFEHVVGAASIVGDLLESCSSLEALVTSRVRLRVTGEHEIVVPPLEVPSEQDEDPESLARLASVALFVDRARAVLPDFALDDANAAAVAAICRQLDGLPLAIELAAARIKLFSPQALLARLGRRLELLTAGPRDRPARHRTLRQAIAWSYDLLEPDQQAFFRRLSVFAGGCTLDAAVDVCYAATPLDYDAIETMSALVDQSLVRRQEGVDAEPRFLMLETIREYAHERLVEAGEVEATREAHARHFLQRAEEAERRLTGPEQGTWLDRLDAERNNLRAALNWAEHTGDAELGLRIATAVWRFWVIRGYLRSGRDRLERLLTLAPHTVPARIRARALSGAATLAHNQGDNRGALAYLEQSLALWRELGDEDGLAHALNNLAWVASERSDFRTAITLAREALALHRTRGDLRGVAVALNNLGWVAAWRGEAIDAKGYHEEGLMLRRRIGDRRGVGFALINLAWAETMRGEYRRAASLLDEADGILARIDDKSIVGWAMVIRALALYRQGEHEGAAVILEQSLERWYDGVNRSLLGWSFHLRGCVAFTRDEARAAELLEESLAVWNEIGSRWGVALGTCALGRIAAAAGDRARAERLILGSLVIRHELADRAGMVDCLEALAELGNERPEVATGMLAAADAERQRIGVPVPPPHRPAYDALGTRLRTTLGDQVFSRVWYTGAERPLDAVVGSILDPAQPPAGAHDTAPRLP